MQKLNQVKACEIRELEELSAQKVDNSFDFIHFSSFDSDDDISPNA